MNFKDKVVWITGASSGIGKAWVETLINQKAKIIVSARREGLLNSLVKQFPKSSIVSMPLDITSFNDVNTIYQRIIDKFGNIDVLICNAGVGHYGQSIRTKIDVFKNVFDVNFFAHVYITQKVLRGMINKLHGHIIVISSVLGKFGMGGRSAYVASKHALHGFYDSLRLEVRKYKIRISLICPGYVDTEFSTAALCEDGNPYGLKKKVHLKGMNAEKTVAKTLQKLSKGRDEIYIGTYEKYAVYLKRWFPNMLNNILYTYRKKIN